MDDKIRQLADTNRKFYDQATKYTEILNKADTLRTQRQILDDHMHKLRSTTRELADSDKEIQAAISHHSSKEKQQKLDRDQAQREVADEQDSLNAFERKRSLAQTARGKLEAEKQRHKQIIDDRHRMIRDLSVKHNIPGFDHNLTPAEMDDFVDRLDQNITAQSSRIDQLKVSFDFHQLVESS